MNKENGNQSFFLSSGEDWDWEWGRRGLLTVNVADVDLLSSTFLAWVSCSALSLKYLSNTLGRNLGIRNVQRIIVKYTRFTDLMKMKMIFGWFSVEAKKTRSDFHRSDEDEDDFRMIFGWRWRWWMISQIWNWRKDEDDERFQMKALKLELT